MPTRKEAWPNGTPCWIDLTVRDTGGRTIQRRPVRRGGSPGATGGWRLPQVQAARPRHLGDQPASCERPFRHSWSTYLTPDDLDTTAAKAKDGGSHFTMEPMDVRTSGRPAFAIDPTGAPYGIWQGSQHHGR